MLIYNILDNDGKIKTINKIEIAMQRLREFVPPEGYYLAFSGGKDSQCIYHLAVDAGVKFDAHYNLTTADPPEIVRFIKSQYPDVIIDKPEMSMWQLIPKKLMPPTQLIRYCCDVLKEQKGTGRMVVTGVRWAESVKRKNNRAVFELLGSKKQNYILMNDNDEARKMFETCIKPERNKRIVNPIIDWEDEDVWEYIKLKKLKYCSLYDEGFKRVGCIGCPMASTKGMVKGFERWPKYKQMYLKAFGRMIQERHKRGLMEGETKWVTPEEVMNWWIYRKKDIETYEGQIELEESED